MLLPYRSETVIDPDKLIFGTVSPWPAKTIQLALDPSGPIGAINVTLQFTMKACAANTLVTFGLLNVLKQVSLNIRPNSREQYDCVMASGPGLMALAEIEDLGVDDATRQAIWASNANLGADGTNIIAGEIYRINYRIPCYHPGTAGWLAVRQLLHTQTHRQSPVLKLDFAPAAEIFTGADPFSAATVEVWLERYDITDDLTKKLLESGGFIDWEIRETAKEFPAGLTNVERYTELPGDREYANLALWHEANGATLADLSGNTAAGTETIWKLAVGQQTKLDFRMKHLAMRKQRTRAGGPAAWLYPLSASLNDASAAGVTSGAPPVWVTAKRTAVSPWLGGDMTAGLAIQNPAVVGLEFIADGIQGASDLSSALNNKFAGESKYRIVGNITTPAGNPSFIKFCARSFLSDISTFKDRALANLAA